MRSLVGHGIVDWGGGGGGGGNAELYHKQNHALWSPSNYDVSMGMLVEFARQNIWPT